MNEDLAYYETFNQIPSNKVRSKGAQTKPKAGHQPPRSLMKKHERLQSSHFSLHNDKENETPNGS